MRKTITTIVAMALVIGCTGCGSQHKRLRHNRSAQTESAATHDTPVIAELKSPNGLPTVVDMYADWCGPCQQFRPIFHAAEETYRGKVDFRTINVDEESALAGKLGVESIPTIIFLTPEGNEVGRFTGLMPAEQLHQAIDTLLSMQH